MPNELSRINRRMIWAASALALAVLGGLGWSIVRAVDQHEQARAWLLHSHAILDQLDGFRVDVESASVAERNYLMSGDDRYGRLYAGATTAGDARLKALAALTQGDPAQQLRLAHLRRIWLGRQAQMREHMRVRRTAGLQAATQAALTPAVKKAVDRLQVALRYMRGAEAQALTVRRDTLASMSSVVYVMMALMFVLAVGLAVAVVWLLGYVRRLQGGFVTVCAWTKQVRDGQEWMSLEAYLVRRFGLKITHGISDDAAANLLSDLDPRDDAAPER